LFTLFEEGLPSVRNHRLRSGRGKVIEAAADNLFARQTEELAGAGTDVSIPAIVVGDQNRSRRLVYDRAEQLLKFFRTIGEQPRFSLRL
jgi:hypothetical protein